MPPKSMRTPFRKLHRLILGIEQYVAKVDRGNALSICASSDGRACEVVHIADAGVGNVERAVGEDRVLLGGGQQIEQLLADPHRTVRRLGVDQGNLAGGLVGAHRLIDVPHFVEHRIDRGSAFAHRPPHSTVTVSMSVGDAPHQSACAGAARHTNAARYRVLSVSAASYTLSCPQITHSLRAPCRAGRRCASSRRYSAAGARQAPLHDHQGTAHHLQVAKCAIPRECRDSEEEFDTRVDRGNSHAGMGMGGIKGMTLASETDRRMPGEDRRLRPKHRSHRRRRAEKRGYEKLAEGGRDHRRE